MGATPHFAPASPLDSNPCPPPASAPELRKRGPGEHLVLSPISQMRKQCHGGEGPVQGPVT